MMVIAADEALRVLAEWAGERPEMYVALARSLRQRTAGEAVVKGVLPHTGKVLLTMRDETGQDVAVTVSVEGAEWEFAPGGGVVPKFAAVRWSRYLAATFPNGSRYVFGARAGDGV